MKNLKNMIFILAALFTTALYSSSQVMQIPSDFLSNGENNEVNLNNSKTKEFGKYVDNIFSYQENVLNNAKLDSASFVGGWKISGYKTDLAISKSGVFGVGALKATTAAELQWAKKSDNIIQKNYFDDTSYTVGLNDEMSDDEIREELAPIVNMIMSSGKVKKGKKFRKNLFIKTKEMHSLMKDIFNNGDYHWEVSKFRLNLSVGVSGNLFYYANIGGDVRVRLEWKRLAVKKESFIAKQSKRKKLNKLVNKLIKEVAVAAEDYESTKPNYKVDKVSIGIGMSKKGVWGIAKSKFSSSGVLFFKKVKNPPAHFISQTTVADNDKTELFLIDNSSANFIGVGKLFKVPAKKFRKGLKKAFKISKWLSKKASKHSGNWYVKKIKVVFGLSYKGIFGLSNTSGSATAEIYLKS